MSNDRSITNALVTITTVVVTHFVIAWLKQVSPGFGRIVDGTPLVLLEKGKWHIASLRKMRISRGDVMSTARAQGLKSLEDIDYPVLERNGEISILPARKES